MESPEITMITGFSEMRALAAWYRDLAESTDNPIVWEGRLHAAEALDQMATRADLGG